MRFGFNPPIILSIFRKLNLAIFRALSMNGQGVPCGRNLSYSFIPILSKLHRCFGHGLKICMWCWYNPQIFCYFSQVELSHFSGIFYNKVNGQGIPLLQFYTDICETSLVLWSWSEDMHVVRYNPQIIFVTFFAS